MATTASAATGMLQRSLEEFGRRLAIAQTPRQVLVQLTGKFGSSVLPTIFGQVSQEKLGAGQCEVYNHATFHTPRVNRTNSACRKPVARVGIRSAR